MDGKGGCMQQAAYRHICGTTSTPCLGFRIDQSAADAKVAQFEVTSFIQKYVRRFYIFIK